MTVSRTPVLSLDCLCCLPSPYGSARTAALSWRSTGHLASKPWVRYPRVSGGRCSREPFKLRSQDVPMAWLDDRSPGARPEVRPNGPVFVLERRLLGSRRRSFGHTLGVFHKPPTQLLLSTRCSFISMKCLKSYFFVNYEWNSKTTSGITITCAPLLRLLQSLRTAESLLSALGSL